MDALGPWHLLIIAAVFVMLFGAKRLPDAARSVGRSARILKSELKEAVHDDDPPTTRTTTVPAVTAAPVTPATPVEQVVTTPPATEHVVAADPVTSARS